MKFRAVIHDPVVCNDSAVDVLGLSDGGKGRDDRADELAVVDIDNGRVDEVPGDLIWIVIHGPAPAIEIAGDIKYHAAGAAEIQGFETC